MRDTAMALPDGRSLAYTEFGARDGPLVVYCHGAPTCRLELAYFAETLGALGARVVAPDRPGYGGSSARPRRALNDWPDDVAALADHLGAARFAVLGLSSGGPYAVACAALLTARVAAAGVVAGVTDMGWPDAWHGYYENEATVMRLGDERAAAIWLEDRYGADGSGLSGETTELAPADMAMLGDEARVASLFASLREGFRQGVGGYAQDLTIQGRPWSFDPAAITAPTRVLHGEADTLVPVAHARHTADLITGATLVTFPEHGHLSIMDEIPQLAADLGASAS